MVFLLFQRTLAKCIDDQIIFLRITEKSDKKFIILSYFLLILENLTLREIKQIIITKQFLAAILAKVI